MALAAAVKFVNIPLEARSLPKRGRRSQATKALLVQ